MSKPRILIVDDEEFFRHLFTDILSAGGLYEIEAVDSGKTALDYAAAKEQQEAITLMKGSGN